MTHVVGRAPMSFGFDVLSSWLVHDSGRKLRLFQYKKSLKTKTILVTLRYDVEILR